MLEKQNSCCSMDYDVPVSRRIAIKKKLFAKAIYDNLADTPDELAFKKGDILTVIEQDTEGIQGWWLCTLRGRQGLCPGNRLRILNSYDSGCFSPSPASSPSPSLAASTATLNSSICSAETYENGSIISGASGSSAGSGSGVISASQTQLNQQQQKQHPHHPQQELHNHHQHPHQQHHYLNNHAMQQAQPQQQQQQQQYRQGTRRSWHVSPNKVITPQRYGDVYIYNCSPTSIPSTSSIQQQQQLLRAQQLQQQQIYSNQSIYQNLSMMTSTTSSNGSGHEFETYDVPKPATPVNNYDCPKSVCRTPTSTGPSTRFEAFKNATSSGCNASIEEESYDVPRPLNTSVLQHQHNLTPSSSNSSLLTSDSLSLSFSSSNRSSLANMPDYDIPRRNPLPVRAVHQLAAQQRQSQQLTPNASANCMTYDFPLPAGVVGTAQQQQQEKGLAASNSSTNNNNNSSNSNNTATKELPLELNSALETLAKLQSETTTAITRLLSFVVPNWRTREKLEPNVMELKLAAVRLRTALHDLTEFSEGALGNASRSEDRNLALKLRPLVRALRDADKLIHDSSEVLEAQGGWTLEHLMRSDDKSACKPPDSLDQLIACAQTLTEDVRSTTSFVQGNASLLFKRQLPNSSSSADIVDHAGANNMVIADAIAPGASNRTSSAEWLEDYDYVSFESKDAAAKKNSALREAIPANMKSKFDTVIKVAESSVMATTNAVSAAANAPAAIPANMTDKDKMLVRYYAVQISTHMGNLRQAIDSFLETVEKNQPPKFFIAYGKFVVVSAHNLVSIGDIVHRNISKEELREKILRCTDALSDALKTCVHKSKRAAAHFPSVTAVQEMVDSVVDISHLASDLKTAMLQAVQLTI